MSDNVEGLRASITKAQMEIEKIQSALNLVMERVDSANHMVTSFADDSKSQQITFTLVALAGISEGVEPLIIQAMEAIEQLEAYAATR